MMLTLFITLGMCPYLYMPIVASFKPRDSWGDQSTIYGFGVHFFRFEVFALFGLLFAYVIVCDCVLCVSVCVSVMY